MSSGKLFYNLIKAEEEKSIKTRKAYLFLIPGTILFLTFSIYPIFKALQMSFSEWSLFGHSHFIGWQNYIRALTDPNFRFAMRNTIYYGLVTVPGQMIIAMIVAVLLDRELIGRLIYRALYFLPVITSWVVVSFIFKYLFNQQGLLNYILHDLMHIIPGNISWLTNSTTALFGIMVVGIWKGIGWTMVIYLGGLASIPRELYEAAKVDGANGWQQFWRITLPLLRPTITFVLIMLVIGSFNVFISVYIMTGGGPLGQTEVALTYMYRYAFDYLELGYGAAIAYILAIIIFVVSIIQYKFLRVPTEY